MGLQRVGQDWAWACIAIIILNGEKLKAFLLNSEAKQGCLLLTLPVNTIWEVLAIALRWEKEIKKYLNWKGRGKIVTIFRRHGTLCK